MATIFIAKRPKCSKCGSAMINECGNSRGYCYPECGRQMILGQR